MAQFYQLDAFKSFEQVKAEEENRILQIPAKNMRALFAKQHEEKIKNNGLLKRVLDLEEIVFRMNERVNNIACH